MPAIGIGQPASLVAEEAKEGERIVSPLTDALPSKAKIIAVNGKPTTEEDVGILDAAVQDSKGRPVDLRIEANGKQTTVSPVPGIVIGQFNPTDPMAMTDIIGLQPRVRITGVKQGSAAALAGLKAGDVVHQISLEGTGETLQPPSVQEFLEWIKKVVQSNNLKLRLIAIRDGQPLPPVTIDQAMLEKSKRVLGVAYDYEMAAPIVARAAENTPVAKAGLKKSDRIVAVGERSVETWFDVINALTPHAAGDITLTLERDGQRRQATFSLTDADSAKLKNLRYQLSELPLAPLTKIRKTLNPIEAARWGVEETKQSIFSVYRTLRSLFAGTVPLSNLSGPVGIFNAGTAAAKRGPDWLIWFMALISANLAVVNFLPIPIVDGGLFIFLLAEKITGRPPSPRVQAIAQMVGIALLGTLFLYATYHDLLRAFG
jgi:regulator of sigma E protease